MDMLQELLKAIPVFLSSMVKFILGPIGGKAAGLPLPVTIVATFGAMMTVVVMVTYFGSWVKKKWMGNPSGTVGLRKTRWSLFIDKFGLGGVAFLTPLFLTPIGGALLAVGIEGSRKRIILHMAASAFFWSVLLSCAIYFGFDAVYAWWDR